MFGFRHKPEGLNPIQHLATESERTTGRVNRNVKALTVAEIGLVLLLTFLALFAVVSVVHDIIVAGCHQLAESLGFVNVHSFPPLPYWPFIALLVVLLLYLFRPWRLFRKRGYVGGASFAALDFANELQARHELAAAQRQKILTYILVGLTLLLAVSLLFAVVTRHLPGAAKTSASCLLVGGTVPATHAKYPTPPLASVPPTPLLHPSTSPTPYPGITPTPSSGGGGSPRPSGGATPAPSGGSGTVPVSQAKPTPTPRPGGSPTQTPTPGATPKPKPTPTPTPGGSPTPTPTPTPGGSSPGSPAPAPPTLAVAHPTEPVGQSDTLTVSKLAERGDTAVFTNTKTGKAVGTCTSGTTSTSCVVQVTSTAAGSVTYVATDADTGLSSNPVTIDWTATPPALAVAHTTEPVGQKDALTVTGVGTDKVTVYIDKTTTSVGTCTGSAGTCQVQATSTTIGSVTYIATDQLTGLSSNTVTVNWTAAAFSLVSQPLEPSGANWGNGYGPMANDQIQLVATAPSTGTIIIDNPQSTTPLKTCVSATTCTVLADFTTATPNVRGGTDPTNYQAEWIPDPAAPVLANGGKGINVIWNPLPDAILVPSDSLGPGVPPSVQGLSNGQVAFNFWVGFQGSTVGTQSANNGLYCTAEPPSALGQPNSATQTCVRQPTLEFINVNGDGSTTGSPTTIQGSVCSASVNGCIGSVPMNGFIGPQTFTPDVEVDGQFYPGVSVTESAVGVQCLVYLGFYNIQSCNQQSFGVGPSLLMSSSSPVNGNGWTNRWITTPAYPMNTSCLDNTLCAADGTYQLYGQLLFHGTVVATTRDHPFVIGGTQISGTMPPPTLTTTVTANVTTAQVGQPVLLTITPSMIFPNYAQEGGAPTPDGNAIQILANNVPITPTNSQCTQAQSTGQDFGFMPKDAIHQCTVLSTTTGPVTYSAYQITNPPTAWALQQSNMPTVTFTAAAPLGLLSVASSVTSTAPYAVTLPSTVTTATPFTIWDDTTGSQVGSCTVAVGTSSCKGLASGMAAGSNSYTAVSAALVPTNTATAIDYAITLTSASSQPLVGVPASINVHVGAPGGSNDYFNATVTETGSTTSSPLTSIGDTGPFTITGTTVGSVTYNISAWSLYQSGDSVYGSIPLTLSYVASPWTFTPATQTFTTSTGKFPTVAVSAGAANANATITLTGSSRTSYPGCTLNSSGDCTITIATPPSDSVYGYGNVDTYQVIEAGAAVGSFTVTWDGLVAAPTVPATVWVPSGQWLSDLNYGPPNYGPPVQWDAASSSGATSFTITGDNVGGYGVDTATCTSANMACNLYPPTTDPAAPETKTYTVTDAAGESTTFTVTWAPAATLQPALPYAYAGSGGADTITFSSSLPAYANQSNYSIALYDNSSPYTGYSCNTNSAGSCTIAVPYTSQAGVTTYDLYDQNNNVIGAASIDWVPWKLQALPAKTVALAASATSVPVAVTASVPSDVNAPLTITGSDGSSVTCTTNAQGACPTATAVTYDGKTGPITYTVTDAAGGTTTFKVTWQTSLILATPSASTAPATSGSSVTVAISSSYPADANSTLTITGSDGSTVSCTTNSNGTCPSATAVTYDTVSGLVTYTVADSAGNTTVFSVIWGAIGAQVASATAPALYGAAGDSVVISSALPADQSATFNITAAGSTVASCTATNGSCVVQLSYPGTAGSLNYTVTDPAANSTKFTINWTIAGLVTLGSASPPGVTGGTDTVTVSNFPPNDGVSIPTSSYYYNPSCTTNAAGACTMTLSYSSGTAVGTATQYTVDDNYGNSVPFSVTWSKLGGVPAAPLVPALAGNSIGVAVTDLIPADVGKSVAITGSDGSSTTCVVSSSGTCPSGTAVAYDGVPGKVTYTLTSPSGVTGQFSVYWDLFTATPSTQTVSVGAQGSSIEISDAAGAFAYGTQGHISSSSGGWSQWAYPAYQSEGVGVTPGTVLTPGAVTYTLQFFDTGYQGNGLPALKFTIDYAATAGSFSVTPTVSTSVVGTTPQVAVANKDGVNPTALYMYPPGSSTGTSPLTSCTTSGNAPMSCVLTGFTSPTAGYVTYELQANPTYVSGADLASFEIDWISPSGTWSVSTSPSEPTLGGSVTATITNTGGVPGVPVTVGSTGSLQCVTTGSVNPSCAVTLTAPPDGGTTTYPVSVANGMGSTKLTTFTVAWPTPASSTPILVATPQSASMDVGASAVDPVSITSSLASDAGTKANVAGSDGSTYSCTLSGAGNCSVNVTATSPGLVTYTATDAAGDITTFTVSWLPSGLTVNDGTGTGSVPSTDTVTIMDGYSGQASTTISVSGSDYTAYSCQAVNGMCSVSLYDGDAATGPVTYTVTDGGGHTATFVVTWGAPATLSLSTYQYYAGTVLTVTAPAADVGTSVAITGTDGYTGMCTVSASWRCFVTDGTGAGGTVTYVATDSLGNTATATVSASSSGTPPTPVTATITSAAPYVVGDSVTVGIAGGTSTPYAIKGSDGSSYSCGTFNAQGVCPVELASTTAGTVTYTVAAGEVSTTFTIDWVAKAITAAPTVTTLPINGTDVVALSSTYSADLVSVTYTVSGSDGSSYTCSSPSSNACAVNVTASAVGKVTYTVGDGQGHNTTFTVDWTAVPVVSAQTITFTSTAPTSAVVGGTYTPTATSSSGLPVTLTIDSSSASVCSIASGVVSFQEAGTCTIDANQGGSSSYSAAPQVQQAITVGVPSTPVAQTITFTSTPPSNASVGDIYTVAATASSGLPVALTVASSSTSVCSISDGVVSLVEPGTCTIDANQAGNASYASAKQVQQGITVGAPATALSQTIMFTSTAPSGATVGGTYTPTATASSELPVTLTIDSSSASVCSISSGVVTFLATGTCTIDANQAGNSSYTAAPQVQQAITVG